MLYIFFYVQGIYYLAYTDNIGKWPVVTLLMPTKRNKKLNTNLAQLIN